MKILREEMPRYGLSYGDETRVRILLLRGNGRIIHQGYEIRDHPNPDFVIVQREGGEPHCSDGIRCNCEGFKYRKRCNHIDVLNAVAPVPAIKNSLDWWLYIKEVENG